MLSLLPPLYLLHPIAVHFPVALLTVGLAAAMLGRRTPRIPWLAEAASWLLWLGTASAWAAVGLGLLAEKTAPHVPLAWKTLDTHQDLAYWTVGLFTGLSVWRIGKGRLRENLGNSPTFLSPACLPAGRGEGKGEGEAGNFRENLFLLAWLLAWGVLLATAYHGGELVFKYGMGQPQTESDTP